MNLLERYKNNSSVSVKSHDGLHIIKYVSLGVDWSDKETRAARGLILDDNGNIIARPFEKFFNLNELLNRDTYSNEVQNLSSADDGAIEVTDKRDGSLVIAFNHNGKLKFASSGSLDSRHTKMFNIAARKLWDEELFNKVEELSKTYTLLFEYTSPDNRIVLDYDKERIVLIGIRETETGKDFTMKETKEITKGFGLEYVDLLELNTMEEVMEYTSSQEGIEGVVVLFTKTMKRIKIKTKEYLDNHGKLRILTLSRDGLNSEQIELIGEMIIEGKQGDLDDILSRYRGLTGYETVVEEMSSAIEGVLKFLENIDVIAHNTEILREVEGKTYLDVVNSSEKIMGVPIMLLFMVNIDLNKFWKAQADYAIIKEAIKGTVHKRVLKTVKEELGVVTNYNNPISPKSFVFQVLDKQSIWKKAGGLKDY